MGFPKYPSLTNHYREQELFNITVSDTFVKEGWYATEKIHGANFQFSVNTEGFWVGSRTQQVDGQFFKSQSVIDSLKGSVLKAYELLGASEMVIYGELFGGYFPGEKTTASAVQKGIVYSPHLEFLAFDVTVDGQWLSRQGIDQNPEVWGDIQFVPVIAKGLTFEEALAFPEEFDSVIPSFLGYSYGEPNQAEGLVINHYSYTVTNKFGERAVIKKKTKAFTEKKAVGTKAKIAHEAHPLEAEVLAYVTGARYEAVVSKIGDVTLKDMGRVLGAFQKDVFEDAIKDGVLPEEYKKMDGYKSLSRSLTDEIRGILLKRLG